MFEPEVENIKKLNGWAVGTVCTMKDGKKIREIDGALIELLNGEGLTSQYSGVNVYFVEDDEYNRKTGVFGNRKSFIKHGDNNGTYVREYVLPTNPNIVKLKPRK